MPMNPLCLLNHGLLLMRKDRFTEAAETFGRALQATQVFAGTV